MLRIAFPRSNPVGGIDEHHSFSCADFRLPALVPLRALAHAPGLGRRLVGGTHFRRSAGRWGGYAMKVGARVKLVEWPKELGSIGRTPGELGRIRFIGTFSNGQPAYAVRLDLGGAAIFLTKEHIALADAEELSAGNSGHGW